VVPPERILVCKKWRRGTSQPSFTWKMAIEIVVLHLCMFVVE